MIQSHALTPSAPRQTHSIRIALCLESESNAHFTPCYPACCQVAVTSRALDGKSERIGAGNALAPVVDLCPACGDPEATCTCVDVVPQPSASAAASLTGVMPEGSTDSVDGSETPAAADLRYACFLTCVHALLQWLLLLMCQSYGCVNHVQSCVVFMTLVPAHAFQCQ